MRVDSSTSGAREGEEFSHVAVVSRTQGMEVGGSQFVGVDIEAHSPGERFAVERSDEVVGGDSAVTSVAVRECVDRDQAVMKSNSDSVPFVCAVFDPRLCVIDKIAYLR